MIISVSYNIYDYWACSVNLAGCKVHDWAVFNQYYTEKWYFKNQNHTGVSTCGEGE